MILVTGPTGSGKSTTLYATLNAVSRPEINVITVEDPVEYRIPGINQVQVNPKAGLTFASALRSILRSDPDVVLIGEIRDHETAQIAIEAALTGHLVLSTLHTNDAPSARHPARSRWASSRSSSGSALDCVVAQRLARRLCPQVQGARTSRARYELIALAIPLDPGRRSRPSTVRGLLHLLQDRLQGAYGAARGHARDRGDRASRGRALLVGRDRDDGARPGHGAPCVTTDGRRCCWARPPSRRSLRVGRRDRCDVARSGGCDPGWARTSTAAGSADTRHGSSSAADGR